MEFNYLNNNERSSHKDHFYKVCLQIAMWCRRCRLKKSGRSDKTAGRAYRQTDAGHIVITTAQIGHVLL